MLAQVRARRFFRPSAPVNGLCEGPAGTWSSYVQNCLWCHFYFNDGLEMFTVKQSVWQRQPCLVKALSLERRRILPS